MKITFENKKCIVEFSKYENGNTNFKVYEEGKEKPIVIPTVNVGYIMNKEYVAIKNRDKENTLGKELEKAGVLYRKLDQINLENGGSILIYMLTKKAQEYID